MATACLATPHRGSKLAPLLEGTIQDPRVSTEAYRFEYGEAPGDGIGRIARGQLELTIGLLRDAPHENDSGKAVHDARKTLKRLRALLRVSRGMIDDQLYHRENVILRDVGRALSKSRDAQVLLDTLDGLTERYADVLREGAWARLRESLGSAVEDSRTIGAPETDPLVDLLSDARARTETWIPSDNSGPESLASGFARVYRRGRRRLAAARSQANNESLHELRKRAKDLWHAAQLLEAVSAKQMRELGRGAHRLSDLLGEDHDLTILREYAQRQAERLTATELELLMALIGCRQEALRREGLDRATELYRLKPKQLLRRLALA